MVNENKALIKADPFSLMDFLDDNQIVQEIKGVVLKEWCYSITLGGKTVEGLSKAGIDACTSELSRKRGEVLREIDFQLIQNPDDVIATVKAGRFVVSQDGREVMLETVFGVKRQARQEEIYDRDANGEKVYDTEGQPIKHLRDDPFVVEKALMKAARNAKKRLIPGDLQAMILKQARETGRVRTVTDNEPTATVSDSPLCPVHHKPMTKGQYGWYCQTKVGDGWCKAKPTEAKPAPTTEAGVADVAQAMGIPQGPPLSAADADYDKLGQGPAVPVETAIQKQAQIDEVSRALTDEGWLPAIRVKLFGGQWWLNNHFPPVEKLSDLPINHLNRLLKAATGHLLPKPPK